MMRIGIGSSTARKDLISLGRDERFKRVLAELRSELHAVDVANRSSADTALYRGQGKAVFISELLDLAEDQPLT